MVPQEYLAMIMTFVQPNSSPIVPKIVSVQGCSIKIVTKEGVIHGAKLETLLISKQTTSFEGGGIPPDTLRHNSQSTIVRKRLG